MCDLPRMEKMKMSQNNKFNKVLNPWDVLVTAFGAMIGWGWVVSTGGWLSRAGVTGTVLGFVIGGVMIYFVGLTYAELTTAMPMVGGERVFSLKAFGPTGSFICTWFLVLSYVGVVCFEACSLPTVIQYIFPGFLKGYLYTIAGFDVYATWLVVGIICALSITYVNIRGIKAAATLQTVLTIIIAAVGLVLVAASALKGTPANLNNGQFHGDNTVEAIKNILSVAVIAPFFLFGFDVIPQVAEEIKVPLKKLGRLMLLSIVLAVAFYGLVVFAVGYVMSPQDVNNSLSSSGLVTADAMAKAFSSDSMSKVLILGGICGIITSWNSFMIGGSRALFSMSEAHMLPSFFGKLSSKKTPINALIFVGVLSIISLFLGRSALIWISDTASLACCIAYCMVSMSFLVLRRKEPELKRPYKVKRHKLVGSIATIMSATMVLLYLIPGSGCTLSREEWSIACVWVLLGIIMYAVAKSRYKSQFGKN